MQETQDTWVRFLGWEDPLEEEMATYSSILAWEISWTGEPEISWTVEPQSTVLQRFGHDSVLKVTVNDRPRAPSSAEPGEAGMWRLRNLKGDVQHMRWCKDKSLETHRTEN